MKIVVLTGAGISAESGLNTFRDAGGLWENHRIEDVATPRAFARNPSLVQNFYNARRKQLDDPSVAPNAAHFALVELEKAIGKDFLLVTQNVDDLHQRAGSERMIAMHGELRKCRCTACQKVSLVTAPLSTESVCKYCKHQGTVRPHIVWFEEMPLQMQEIYHALENCDIFVSIGTSSNVYPAAGFVEVANQANAETLELNLEPSSRYSAFKEHRQGPATQLVPEWVESLLQQR
ncbi:MAG TPA: Sir2 family NAD+-dependent deacetylase [Alcanivoracaceae bacterium]|nr:Sir2 family NAD+-dependent deacetylase [Alcanivoracaceae bacterium]